MLTRSFRFLFTTSCPTMLEIPEIVSLLYIAKIISVRVAMDLIKIKIALSPNHDFSLSPRLQNQSKTHIKGAPILCIGRPQASTPGPTPYIRRCSSRLWVPQVAHSRLDKWKRPNTSEQASLTVEIDRLHSIKDGVTITVLSSNQFAPPRSLRKPPQSQ